MIYHLTELECWARDLPRAEELARRCLELAGQLPPSNTEQSLRYAAALVDAYRGRVEAALEGARLGGAAARERGDALGEMRNELVLGFLALSLGDPKPACEHLRPLVERLRASGIVEPGVVPALPLAAEAMVGVGDLVGAATLADELEDLGEAARSAVGAGDGGALPRARCGGRRRRQWGARPHRAGRSRRSPPG